MRFGPGAVRILAGLAVTCPGALAGCTAGPTLRGRAEGLNAAVVRAERSGAKTCAPRELAIAQAHLRFATVDLAQGQLGQADDHLTIAEPNARAALALSPFEKCRSDAPMAPAAGDRDGDGLPDETDKCPDEAEVYNAVQDEDGCPDDPDSDGDGVLDSVDHCLIEREDVDGYLDDDGCPDLDDDADGVADGVDRCPRGAEDPDGWEDEDGCPDPDNDKDTLLDVEDACPNTAGPPGGERPGCARKDAPVVVTGREIRITQQVQFELGRAVIKRESFALLDAVRDVLRQYTAMTIEVQGHTDNMGNGATNQTLSEQRAAAVRKYLVEHGIEGARLTAKGYGATQPLLPNTTGANRALNRRVQFIRTETK